MIAKVLVELTNRNVDKEFDYKVPSSLEPRLKVGIRVKVPFATQTLEGFVLAISEASEYSELKEIFDVIDEDIVLTDELLSLGKIIKEKTLCTLISAYQAMLPKALKAQHKTLIRKKMEKCLALNVSEIVLENFVGNEKQKLVLEMVSAHEKVRKKEAQFISSSAVQTLLRKGILKEFEVESYMLENEVLEIEKKKVLTSDQQGVVNSILSLENLPQTCLLHGVTGSGKTEVYMEIIEHLLSQEKTSIMLVPEISLTPQMVERFQKRFASDIAILHSRLNETEKYDEYRKISRGEVKIVIGARSAVFAPLTNIGAIIIDEEHTTSYKQENNPKYSAIDVAIERSKYHKCLVILGSATPSLETYARAITGNYQLFELKKRVNQFEMPKVEIIDMSKEKKKDSYFSKRLIEEIQNKLAKKEQIILLLNRRGYASFITCSNCGYVLKCPNCDITLTYHKTSGMCRCHYCGYATPSVEVCPSCHEAGIKNLGVGTEKVEEELLNLFQARVIRMDLDTTTSKGSHERIIDSFRKMEYDILLGTQMIAKGLDFSNVTLVGVINADISLMIPNFKSSEYTFQLLSQVAGRCGRGEKKGNVVIQTFNPDHYAIVYAKNHDYLSFFQYEMNIRKQLKYSPYYYLISLKVMSEDYSLVSSESAKIAAYLKEKLKHSIVLGPSVSNIFKVKNVYRFGIIIKYKKEEVLLDILNGLLEHYKVNSKLRIDIDFNPNVI